MSDNKEELLDQLKREVADLSIDDISLKNIERILHILNIDILDAFFWGGE